MCVLCVVSAHLHLNAGVHSLHLESEGHQLEVVVKVLQVLLVGLQLVRVLLGTPLVVLATTRHSDQTTGSSCVLRHLNKATESVYAAISGEHYELLNLVLYAPVHNV